MNDERSPVVHLDEVALRDWGHGTRFEARLGRIGPAIGARALGCQLHIVPPGKAAFPRHAHHANEEMLVILSGAGTFRLGETSWPVRAGHVCAAPAGGLETAHELRNTGAEELRYLCISTLNDPDVLEYPDSGKRAVASMRPEGGGLAAARVFHIWHAEDAALEYWEGEP